MTGVVRISMKSIAGAAALAILLTGCAARLSPSERVATRPHASKPVLPSDLAVWRLREVVVTDKPRILLQGAQGAYAVVDSGLMQRILATGEKILDAAGKDPEPEWIVTESGSINAFAFVDNAQPTIAVSLGMIHLLGDDLHAWAALFGHELAHLRLDHLKTMKDRRKTAEITSSVAGVISSVIGLPFGSLVADATVELAGRAYSRDDERDADRLGLDYMRRAGFPAQGAIRLQERLLSRHATSPLPFLSTHPTGEERIQNLRELMRNAN